MLIFSSSVLIMSSYRDRSRLSIILRIGVLRRQEDAKVAELQSMKATSWNMSCHLLITIVVSRVASTLDFQFVLQYVMKKRKTESLLVGN